MSIRIVGEEPEAGACFYDSVTGLAFGPVFESVQEADDFLEWYDLNNEVNLLTLNPADIGSLQGKWREQTQ